eukprot:CAMPEP_0179057330 /NCGR_PEP_ID=MMETSP0796-20121207/24279_1 /TAXON_ID=73915 /ORGANISM="Pyrodinium bahamense, Strain pbaha01" /LENGTH=117 /DNA_ID=CAMNT_0020754047 /DNA_START=818 /DNA_END=1168 /DNA_ORIENTATION=+
MVACAWPLARPLLQLVAKWALSDAARWMASHAQVPVALRAVHHWGSFRYHLRAPITRASAGCCEMQGVADGHCGGQQDVHKYQLHRGQFMANSPSNTAFSQSSHRPAPTAARYNVWP